MSKYRKIPDKEVVKLPGLGFVTMIVKKQEGAKLKDYIAAIRETGEEIDRGELLGESDKADTGSEVYTGDQTNSEGPTYTGEPIVSIYTGKPLDETEPTYTERGGDATKPIEENKEPIYTGEIGSITESTDENEEEKDEEKKKKRPIGKYIKRGIITGLAILLLVSIAATKQVTHETTITPSDYASIVEISDLNLVEIEGQYIQYAGTVYDDPGQLIHDMRDLAIGEYGTSRYFEETPEEERIAEEERILEISEQFQEQQNIIVENEQTLKSPSASDEEKKEAIQNIIAAKGQIKGIYTENQDLYNKYADMARDAYRKDGGDERTEHEVELAGLNEIEYGLAIENLELDINHLGSCIYTLNNPQTLFEEEPAPEGTVDERYIIDIGPIEFGKIKETEVTNLEYDPSITINDGNTTVTSGEVVITEEAIQQTNTTRKGIFAVVDIINRAIKGKEIGEISIFGHKVHDDPHIK